MKTALKIYFFVSLLTTSTFAQQERKLLLVGGALADDNADIYGKFIEMSGGAGVARIGIVTAASSSPFDSADFYETIFAQYGAVETYWIPVWMGNPGAALDPSVVVEVERMTGFFFGGGDQSRIITCFYLDNGEIRTETEVLKAMRLMYENGTAAAGGFVLTVTAAGESYNALKYGAFPDGDGGRANDLLYNPDGGIGFAASAIVDTHFSQRGREGRLMRLVSDTKYMAGVGTTLGIGVDENTAIAITSDVATGGNRFGEVLGEAGVFMVDLSRAVEGVANGEWACDAIYANFLRAGDTIDIESWTGITYASYKTNMVGNEFNTLAYNSERIFYGDGGEDGTEPELSYVATWLLDSLANTAHGDTQLKTPAEFRLIFSKSPSSPLTIAYGGYRPSDGFFDVSYQDLRIDIAAL